MKYPVTLLSLLSVISTANRGSCEDVQNDSWRDNKESGQLALIEPLLVVSTLDGLVYAIGQRSGTIRWTIKEEPVVRVPQMPNITEGDDFSEPLFLPDPKDGSLYVLNNEQIDSEDDPQKEKDALQKMPFTISELVSASPCKSSDGLLYTGQKFDSWITVNARTGEKIDIMDSSTPMCKKPDVENATEGPTILIGKSLYQLSIFDSKTRNKKWNITLVDYSSSASSVAQSSYTLLHLTSTTTGKIVTIDLDAGGDEPKMLWTKKLDSPIISMFEFDESGAHPTRKVPFTTVGDPSIAQRPFSDSIPSLYIGESPVSKQAYALSALVPFDFRLLSRKRKRTTLPLLEGPANSRQKGSQHSRIEEYFQMLIYGFYEYPEYSKTDFSPSRLLSQIKQNLLEGKPSLALPDKGGEQDRVTKIPYLERDDELEVVSSSVTLGSMITAGIIATAILFVMYDSFNKKNPPKVIDPNIMDIGKISFNVKDIIGRGSAGTCVYKGIFEDSTQVAVKRVISEHFTLAKREIDLLRTLQHPNVVRYFSTESDSTFHYIAIELAEFSLADFVEKRHDLKDCQGLDEIDILVGSCRGLSHLHSINVIHRDIKPHNILIAKHSMSGERKVLISDFGVSKTLSGVERTISNDFITTTRVVKGTDGWIAPEVLKTKIDGVKTPAESVKNSKQIDIFSMGCLFYYVFTEGRHPFGDNVERQSNIVNNKSDLSYLSDEEHIGKSALINSMIAFDPNDRPSIDTVLLHPLFWSKSKKLQFIQDISDRIEKEGDRSDVVILLETGKWDVIRGDWKRYLPVEIQTELNRHRTYSSNSLTALIRAIRNKRHHYRELPTEVQDILGPVPDAFMSYFEERFPRLIYHCYIAIQSLKFEPMFKEYYDQNAQWDFSFPRLPSTGIKYFAQFGSPVKRSKGKKRGPRKKNNSTNSDTSLSTSDLLSPGENQESDEEEGDENQENNDEFQLKPQFLGGMGDGLSKWKSCMKPPSNPVKKD